MTDVEPASVPSFGGFGECSFCFCPNSLRLLCQLLGIVCWLLLLAFSHCKAKQERFLKYHVEKVVVGADAFADAETDDNNSKDYVHIRIQQRNGKKSLTTVQVRTWPISLG